MDIDGATDGAALVGASEVGCKVGEADAISGYKYNSST